MTCTLAEAALQKLGLANNFAFAFYADKLRHERLDARRAEEATVGRGRRRARARSSPLECRICRRAGLHTLAEAKREEADAITKPELGRQVSGAL